MSALRTLLVLAVVVLAGSACGEGVREADDDLPSGGRYVEVEDHRVFVRCTGDGEPAVVLEAGAGLDSSDWAPIQREVARETRVCTYDRPGLGRSDEHVDGFSDEEVASHLAQVLDEAQVERPYVLVGHSMGGLYVRLFEAAYPDAVAGLVLVDSVSGGESDLGGRPLVVLTAGDGGFGAQTELAALSDESVHVIASESGHFIEQDQPALVARAIREVVSAVRGDGSLAACEEVFPPLAGRCVPRGG